MERRRFCQLVGVGMVSGSLWPLRAMAELPSYTIRKGDTLSGIAVSFGTSVDALRRENGLSGDLIRPGQVLRIPSRSGGPDPLEKVRAVSEPKRGGMRTWRYVVFHHSATPTGNAAIYGNYHRNTLRMRNGLAYHFVIGNGSKSGDGEIEIGPRWDRQLNGGHVRSGEVNDHGIGICLVGNFEKSRPTPRQIASLDALTGYLRDLVPNRMKFATHREIDGYAHTVCPGRHFPVARMHRAFPDQW